MRTTPSAERGADAGAGLPPPARARSAENAATAAAPAIAAPHAAHDAADAAQDAPHEAQHPPLTVSPPRASLHRPALAPP